ncbi:MAG: hypothetical protein IRZ16_09225 [Myxococcaceae bacterium]|nr:hypothetical protein [Myxococcaceae bacterium]
MRTESVKRRHKRRRGQAMLEYSMLNWVLVVALVLGMSVRMIPAPDGSGGGRPMNVIELFLRAYQVYYDSFYFVLNLPFP